MGVVYLAEDVRLGRKVVLKFLHPHRSRDAEAERRFSQEARAASSLNLPNICTIYDIGDTDEGGMFIAMAHYDGETLKARLERGVIPTGEAVGIFCQLAQGLHAAHRKGIVHRDIKPANILLATDGRAIILDFGIAKLAGNAVLTRSDALLGTIAYMSPEQAQAMNVGPPSDVWSLGVVLYEMLSRERPFDRAYDHAILYAIINEDAPDVQTVADGVPAPIAGLIRECLSKSPEDRPLLGDGLLAKVAAADLGLGEVGGTVQVSEVASRRASDGSDAGTSATLTLFFSDLEGSTRLLETLGGGYGDVLQSVRTIIRGKLSEYGGEEIDTAGDGLFACFASAGDAACAAVDIQRLITSRDWTGDAKVKLRIGLHTGEPVRRGGTLVGLDVHRAARICAAAHGGQILVSSATERLLTQTDLNGVSLVDLGEYRLKDISAPERLFQVMASGVPGGIHRPRAEGMGGELPVPLTELVGREKELEDLDQIIDSDIRIVTLTGPGGTGKTRLAIEAARRAAHRFESGARFVGLAPISDSDMLLPSISRKLGIPDNPDRSVRDALLEYLKPRSMLLVLDNFEQLVDDAAIVGDLLSEAGGVMVIVTSRIPLRIGGEREYRVPTLPFPDATRDRSLEVMSYPAVALFVDRARIVRPDFSLAGNEKAVAGICARVDGLPLAIELAAARRRLFTPQQLLQRLNSSLDVLQTKGRDVPDRHQTLRGAIAWSYDLLEESEKELFQQLAVFSRGWMLEAATAVCISSRPNDIVEETIESLLERSLLRETTVVGGVPRFGMLEMIREFALEKLVESGKHDELRRRHARYFAGFAEQAEPLLVGEQQSEWFDRLEAEHDNFHAALKWCAESGDVETGMSLGSSLWRFWAVRGYMIQGKTWLERFLRLSSAEDKSVSRARTLNALGTVSHEIGDYSESEALLTEALQIFRTLDDEVGQALVLNNLGWVACEIGAFEEARRLSREALELNRQVGDVRGQSLALNNMGWAATYQSHLREALTLNRESARLRRVAGDRRGLGFSFVNLGWVYRLQARYDESFRHLEDALAIFREIKDTQLEGFAVGMRAGVLWDTGDHQRALEGMTLSLDLWRQCGNKWGVGWSSCALAMICLELEMKDEAEECAQAALDICKKTTGSYPSALALQTTAVVFAATGRRNRSGQQFAEAVRLRAKLGDALGMADMLEEIVRWVTKPTEVRQASVLLEAAASIRKEVGGPPPPRTQSLYKALHFEIDHDISRSSYPELPLEEAIRDLQHHSRIVPSCKLALDYLTSTTHPAAT